MSQTYPIPEASVARLQQAYAQFEQLASVIAEAMGLNMADRFRLDLPNKQFVIGEEAPVNGVVEATEIPA